MYNPFTLQGKTILVTGASSGIGRAVAIECSRLGANLIITGRDERRLKATFEDLDDYKHQMILADLRVNDNIDRLVKSLPCLDGVVHCAGIADPLPFKFVTQQKLEDILKINFISPTLITREIVKKNLLSKNASIVFISSISGVFCSSVGGSMYSASKGAINGLTKGIAIDLATKGIRVNSVCPGMIETNIFEDGRVSKDQLTEDVKRYPLKRYGKPEEVAFAAIYLLSDASVWVTGSNLLIDGGYTLL